MAVQLDVAHDLRPMDDGVRSDPGEGERFENDVRLALIKGALPHLTVLEFTARARATTAPTRTPTTITPTRSTCSRASSS